MKHFIQQALKVLPDAPLYSNRSAVRLALGRFDDAFEDATKATETDASYAKGYYRLGQAGEKCGKFSEAQKAYEKGASLEPESKVWPSSLLKLEKAKQAYEAKPKKKAETAPDLLAPRTAQPIPEKGKENARKSGAVPASESRRASTAWRRRRPASPPSPRRYVDAPDAATATQTRPTSMRGYAGDNAWLSQGRKTTFFNNELDDKTKALIGDIAPKKVAAPTQMKVDAGASSWNQAGTFESKDHTKWMRAWLEAKFRDFMVDLPERKVGALTVPCYLTVKKIKDIKGDASTAQARGKKKWVLDVSLL